MTDHTITVTELIVQTTTLVVLDCTFASQAIEMVRMNLDGLDWFKHKSRITERI